jgi:hypothetical protein
MAEHWDELIKINSTNHQPTNLRQECREYGYIWAFSERTSDMRLAKTQPVIDIKPEPAPGANQTTSGGAPTRVIRKSVEESAGLSKGDPVQALRVANVEKKDTERQEKNDYPPTVIALAEQGNRKVSVENVVADLEPGAEPDWFTQRRDSLELGVMIGETVSAIARSAAYALRRMESYSGLTFPRISVDDARKSAAYVRRSITCLERLHPQLLALTKSDAKDEASIGATQDQH